MTQPNSYISADDLEDIRNAYGMGVPLAELSARVGVSEQQLRRWLGWPEWKPEQPARLPWDLPEVTP